MGVKDVRSGSKLCPQWYAGYKIGDSKRYRVEWAGTKNHNTKNHRMFYAKNPPNPTHQPHTTLAFMSSCQWCPHFNVLSIRTKQNHKQTAVKPASP
eukprot:scaffold6760_cov33-Cyclotella_meneghiniana.AAC.1